MSIYSADLGFDMFRFRCDFAQASSPLLTQDADGEWHSTPYQVADARHDRYRALRLLVEYSGRDYYAAPDDWREDSEILDELLGDVDVDVVEEEETPNRFAIEYLDGAGFWRTLEQSSIDTGFEMRPHPTFATRADAEAHIGELMSLGHWRGLRATTRETITLAEAQA